MSAIPYLRLAASTRSMPAASGTTCVLHAACDAGGRADGNIRFHPTLPQGILPVPVWRVDRAPHTIFVGPHVAVGHRHGVDVRVNERFIPGQRVGHAVDVIPSTGVEPDKAWRERSPNLHQLKARLELLDEHVSLDRADRHIEVPFERGDDVMPQRGFLGSLNLGQVEHQRRPTRPQSLLVVGDVAGEIDDGSGEPAAVRAAHVSIIKVQAARPEDGRRESELLSPIIDDGAAEEAVRPRVHFLGDLFGGSHEHAVSANRESQIALVVQRHGAQLPERILAVEHPAVRTG
jgi:hypothetical protein